MTAKIFNKQGKPLEEGESKINRGEEIYDSTGTFLGHYDRYPYSGKTAHEESLVNTTELGVFGDYKPKSLGRGRRWVKSYSQDVVYKERLVYFNGVSIKQVLAKFEVSNYVSIRWVDVDIKKVTKPYNYHLRYRNAFYG